MDKSATQKIKEHLLSGRSISKLQCIAQYNYINLGDVIYKLRKSMPIDMRWDYSQKGKKFAVYYIPDEYLKDLQHDNKTIEVKKKEI